MVTAGVVVVVKMYFKTLSSSTYVGFHEERRQFIYKVFIGKYVKTKKNYLQECMLTENRRYDPYINISNRIKD